MLARSIRPHATRWNLLHRLVFLLSLHVNFLFIFICFIPRMCFSVNEFVVGYGKTKNVTFRCKMWARRASTTCGRIDSAHGSDAHQSRDRQIRWSICDTTVRAQVGIRVVVGRPVSDVLSFHCTPPAPPKPHHLTSKIDLRMLLSWILFCANFLFLGRARLGGVSSISPDFYEATGRRSSSGNYYVD